MEPKIETFNPPNDQPSAKKDPSGNFVTNRKSLLALYKQEFIKRLSPKPPLPVYYEGQKLKEYLFEKRVQISSSIKTNDWRPSDIINIYKTLKKQEGS